MALETANPVWLTDYDIESRRKDDYQSSLADCRSEQKDHVDTMGEKRIRETLLSRINTFGEHSSGFGRFTRTMFASDLRRKLIDANSKAAE